MTDVSMTIGGERVTAAASFGVINPATGKVHADAPDCSRQQLDRAFEAASGAFAGWSADLDARRAAMKAAAKAIGAAAETVGPVLTAEQGKPIASAIMESHALSYWLHYFARLEMPTEVIQDDEQAYAEVVRRPMGVVAAITPWNFPLCWRAGNSVPRCWPATPSFSSRRPTRLAAP